MLWSAETFVDFEHSLNTSIKELRGVLCDTPSERRYIETLPRLGHNSGSVFLLPSSHVPRIAISDRLAEFCQPICPSYSALFVVG